MEYPYNQPENNNNNIIFTNSPEDNLQTEKRWYEKDFYIIIAFFFFYPLGLFMMWKYSTWKKWVKVFLTTCFVIGLLPLILIWSLIFSIKVKNTINPGNLNTSQAYSCTQVNTEWSKCKNIQYGFSFEYPARWNYMDFNETDLLIGTGTNLKDNYIFSVEAYQWRDNEAAKNFAKGFFGSRAATNINGLFATLDHEVLSDGGLSWFFTAVEGNNTYTIKTSFGIKTDTTGLNSKDLQVIFDHMANSVKKE